MCNYLLINWIRDAQPLVVSQTVACNYNSKYYRFIVVVKYFLSNIKLPQHRIHLGNEVSQPVVKEASFRSVYF